MSEMTREEALAHFGVKGMKWGHRKSSGPGAITRGARSLATGITQDQIDLHKKALSGKGTVGIAAKLDKATWGRNGRFEGYHKQKIRELEHSKRRIAQGELTVQTILYGPQYTKKTLSNSPA